MNELENYKIALFKEREEVAARIAQIKSAITELQKDKDFAIQILNRAATDLSVELLAIEKNLKNKFGWTTGDFVKELNNFNKAQAGEKIA